MSSSSPAADKRRVVNVLLAIMLALVAFGFYLAMFLVGGT